MKGRPLRRSAARARASSAAVAPSDASCQHGYLMSFHKVDNGLLTSSETRGGGAGAGGGAGGGGGGGGGGEEEQKGRAGGVRRGERGEKEEEEEEGVGVERSGEWW